MKYLVQSSPNNKTYTYQRHWPKFVRKLAKEANLPTIFKMPTKCPIEADEVEKALAQQAGNRQWKVNVDLLANMDRMPQHKLETALAGLALLKHTNKVSKYHPMAVNRFKSEATLLGLLDLWLEAHPNQSDKALKDRRRYWSEWSATVGADRVISSDNLDLIHQGLDLWQKDMQLRGCSAATVQRARNSVISVLRWASIEYRVGWNIEPKRLNTPPAKPKAVLTQEQQKDLLDQVIIDNNATGARVAVMLAGGIMPSEIGRLNPEDAMQSLSTSQPYIVIGHGVDVKAEARRRIVPIVWPVEVMMVIRTHLPEAIARAAKAKDSSATVNKWLKTRGFEITGHGLRHTLAAVAGAAMASPIALSRVAGWSSGAVSPIVLGYGAGMADSELVRSLSDECRRWWGHLLPPQPMRLVADQRTSQ